jgi:Holliday junction resolvase-like predicted endonuclease
MFTADSVSLCALGSREPYRATVGAVSGEMAYDNTCLPAIKGDVAELKACIWLLGLGYYVFRNVMAAGPADLVAAKNGETLFIDVKSLGRGRTGYYQINRIKAEHAESRGVRTLFYDHEKNRFLWLEDVMRLLPGKIKKGGKNVAHADCV